MKKISLALAYLVCLLFYPFVSSAANDKAEISRIFKEYKLKEGIIRPPSGFLKHDYLVAQTSGVYHQLFDWDIYFIGLALSYERVGKPLADSVLNFLEYVDVKSNSPGYVPREIAPEGFWALPEMAKPFLAQEAVLASETMGTYDWIEPYYDRLKLTLAYWENSRRAANGLFIWFNGEESGVDNNPAVSEKPTTITEGVDLQVYIYREYKALSVIAKKIGHPIDSHFFLNKADDLKKLILKLMWSPKSEMFLNIDSRTNKRIRLKTWTNFLPMWAGIASPRQAKIMIERHLLNPDEFWSKNGVRTVSKTEESYDPAKGYWRGPVWVISNYLMMHALMEYGYKTQAQDLANKTVKMLLADLRTTKGMNECYNPETGAPTAEGHFLDWDLLGEHMQDEADLGMNPTTLPNITP